MDNASKALIMAGAILISVAIVGIGIYIFSTANSLTDDAVGQIDSLAVDAVNARIYNFCGDNVRGSSVIELYRELETAEKNNTFPEPIKTDGVAKKDVVSNKRYEVVAETDNIGYINKISITEKK